MGFAQPADLVHPEGAVFAEGELQSRRVTPALTGGGLPRRPASGQLALLLPRRENWRGQQENQRAAANGWHAPILSR
jgi:hypothetical protein